MHPAENVPFRSDWERAFRWLAAIELGSANAVEVPDSDEFLCLRTKTLVILFNILPRTEMDRLPQLIVAWNTAFANQDEVSLSELRHVGRKLALTRDGQEGGDALWQKAVRFSRLPEVAAAELSDMPSSAPVSPEGPKKCAEGLLRWFQELKSNPYWNTLSGVVPGESDQLLEEVYVELFAIDDTDAVQQVGAEFGTSSVRRNCNASSPSISMDSMVARILERCVIVGDPGSGKSTLLKWLVWATFREKLPDFDVAVEVKLSAFAAALATDPQLTPLAYFFRSVGQDSANAESAAHAFRQVAKESQRILLLLDGWDEVPAAHRSITKQQMLRESRDFVTVITSRPAGMPRQLLQGQRDCCYRIAGLTPAMGETLTTKLLHQLGQSKRSPAIWNRIRDDIHLREMAANPFLLGLLVRTLLEPGCDDFGTRATTYRRMAALIREQYEMVGDPEAVLTAQHLDRLAQLSFRLLNDPQLPRYLFQRRELEASLQGLDAEPVLRSRFVTKPVTVLDEYSFLHATIQEFMAAEHVSHCSPDEQQEFMERAFNSASRFIVLEFLAGLGGQASKRCHDSARRWWQLRDRFHQVTLRIARLAAAGCWPVDDMGNGIRESLWAEISKQKNDDLKLCQSSVQAYADLDMMDLIRRVKLQPPSSWAINCLMESIPGEIARTHRLDELLPGEWRDVAGLDWMGGATDAERMELHGLLNQWELPAADLREALLQAGSSGDESAIPILIRMAYSVELRDDVREEAITSIGRIGGRNAVHELLNILLNPEATDVMVRMASVGFLQLSNTKLQLDPRGRDRLLRRLAAISVKHPRAEALLTVLEKLPIRDGADVISEFATSSDASLAVSQQAIAALHLVTDRQLLENLLKWIEGRPAELTSTWLQLAWKRSLPIPVPWLMNRVSRSRKMQERDQLMQVLFQVLSLSDFETQSEAVPFLDILALRALASNADQEDLTRALISALNHIASTETILFSGKVRVTATQVLAQASRKSDLKHKQQQLLAVTLVQHFRDKNAIGLLTNILANIYAADFRFEESIDYQILSAAGDCLTHLAPSELLKLPSDHLGQVWALRTRAMKDGWLVYADRILNAEGKVIGTLDADSSPTFVSEVAIDLRSMLERLSPQTRRVLESYWLMVWEGGPCHSRDSYPSIHKTAKSHYDEGDSDLGQRLRHQFPKGFPSFDAWTKQLSHVEAKFSGQGEPERILRALGLYRR
jgi:hypothetical protein